MHDSQLLHSETHHARRLAWAALVLLAAACQRTSATRSPVQSARTASQASAPARSDTARGPSDAEVALAIQRRLEYGGGLPAGLITVRVESGIVTLTGRVKRGSERLRAGDLAEETRGVRAVVNRLEVEPANLADPELAREIQASLKRESADEFRNVTVAAQSSRVTLRGFVAHAQAREMAEKAAWFVNGVTAVDNLIEVAPNYARSDRDVTEDIQRNLKTDVYLGHSPLTASVDKGKVRLSGEVGSIFEKRRARTRSLVAGVTEVDDQAVRVVPRLVRPLAYAETPPGDDQAAAAIRDAFRADPRVPEAMIELNVKYGVVTLTGAVSTLAEKLAASEDARSATGTWAVLNRLEVRSGAAASAPGLTDQVLARLRAHPYVNAERIRVTGSGGALVLEGQVGSRFEWNVAERVAAQVPGVVSIDNRLALGAPSQNLRDDAQIKAQIERELWWDPRVRDAQLEVSVQDGRVTVRGEVANPEVYNAVLEHVFEAAPRDFVNELWRRQPARFVYPE